jgi:DNA repair exonuclease SbcCD ATPase subunit
VRKALAIQGGFMFEESTEPITIHTKTFDEGMSSCKSAAGKTQNGKNGSKQPNNGPVLQIENLTDRLLNLLSDFKCLSDRACIASLKKAESAERFEQSMVSALITLRTQLDERDEDLQAKDEALKRLDTRWRLKFEQLEVNTPKQALSPEAKKIQKKEANARVNGTDMVLHDSDSQPERSTEDLEAEIAALKFQLRSRTACLREKELALRKVEGELQATVQNSLIRIQESEAKLAATETELHEKKIIIASAAVRESEICNLMDRLSCECEQLTEQLQDKIALIARLEDKNHDHPDGGKAWKRVIGLEQPL